MLLLVNIQKITAQVCSGPPLQTFYLITSYFFSESTEARLGKRGTRTVMTLQLECLVNVDGSVVARIMGLEMRRNTSPTCVENG